MTQHSTSSHFQGRCLCGAVHLEITGPLIDVCHCHCSMCRKHHGAAFATFVRTSSKGLRWIKGEADLRHYASSPVVRRGFCSQCGSSLVFHYAPMPEIVWITAGVLEDTANFQVDHHIFVGSKALWYTIEDTLPQHDAFPPHASQENTNTETPQK